MPAFLIRIEDPRFFDRRVGHGELLATVDDGLRAAGYSFERITITGETEEAAEPLTREQAINRLRALSGVTGMTEHWKPWEMSYAIGMAAYRGADMADLRLIADALEVSVTDMQDQPFAATPGREG